jgi:hypothetical protein
MQNLLDDKWWSSNFSVPKLRNWMQIAFLHIIKMFPKHGLFSQNQAFIRSCTKMHLIALFLVINVSNNLYGVVIRSSRNNKKEDYEDFVAKLLTRCFNI